MSMWSEIRERARAWHDELMPSDEALVPASVLLDRAIAESGIRLFYLPPDDILLDGAEGLYDRQGGRILLSSDLAPDHAPFVLAHELAHHRLHDLHSPCSSKDVDVATPAEPERSVVGESDAYSPKERAEAQANLFGREFLLPRGKLRDAWAKGGCNAENLAAGLGLNLGLVLQQLADATLLPDEPRTVAKRAPPPPDPSQLAAATVAISPHQVRAGPGTGKTRTLLARIKWLTEDGRDPATIVALTYSNDSAADLSTRLRREIGELAPSVWTGTFHAFGLELLRKYGGAIGLPLDLKPFDRSDTLFLLEELLPSLQLDHYLDLREPLRALKAVTNAISRAKDQLATPEDYARLARAMAEDSEKAIDAARAAEVAHIYAVYQEVLQARGAADFGDLIMRAHELLANHADVLAEVRAKAQHILVDEYQDMNRASALLLKLLVTPGRGPWVVGDARQSIYRFRGASPVNMTAFAEDFPGAEHTDLKVNYRSGGRIVRTFSAFGAAMAGGRFPSMPKLMAEKGEDAGEVGFSLAATFEAEAEGIARTIVQMKDNGGAYRDHVVLARSHTTLTRLAAHFERAGVPSLYFGDFFERAEIRDLLSLLSVAGEKDGLGLLRVAQTEPYGVPVTDIVTLSEWRRAEDLAMCDALRRLDEVDGLSGEGLAGLELLAKDLEGVQWTTSPHALLLRHLFCKERVRSGVFAESGVAGQQARLAAYQLLQIAFDFRKRGKKDPKAAFLDHIRRLEILDEEKEFRTMPTAAAGIDAVRLMTVHASKGLEFRHVHIAALSPSYFPAPNRYNPCPPPDGLFPDDPLMGRETEEDGLFFVALSRAEDRLSLSRALRYGGRSSRASRLLDPIQAHLPRAVDGVPDWTDEGLQVATFRPLQPLRALPDELPVRTIETYEDCPRRYYYEQGLGLSSRTASSPFLGLISTVRATLAWARSVADEAERAGGWRAAFDQHWSKLGPFDAAFADLYRESGVVMMQRAIDLTVGPNHAVERRMEIGGRMITARADSILDRGTEIIIQRLKAARLAKKETAKTGHGVLVEMVRADHPDLSIAFEHVSLHDGDRQSGFDKPEAATKACADVAEALRQIGDGIFPPKPNDRRCPDCAYYFACPAEGVLRDAT